MVTNSAGSSEFSAGHVLPGRPSLVFVEKDKVVAGRHGLAVEYAGDDACPYGDAATRKRAAFAGLIVHHTAPDHDTDWYVDYQIRGDRERGGHFGYHFFVSQEGRIVQGAPLTKRTNHISPLAKVRRPLGSNLQNTNAIGISCVGAGKDSGFDPTDEQIRAVLDLCFALCDLYSIPFEQIFGHGEIQTNRMKSEGASLARRMRAWQHDDARPPEAEGPPVAAVDGTDPGPSRDGDARSAA